MIESNTQPHSEAVLVRRAVDPQDRQSCLRIRFEVFVDEQQVAPELELDEYDDLSIHYLAFDGEQAVGTARLIPKGHVAKIGRVAVIKQHRGRGIGLSLMQYVIDDALTYGFTEAILDSQTYAIPFYSRLSFVAEGDEFLDAGIPHYLMRRSLRSPEALAS